MDRRYKRILTSSVFAYDVAQLLAQRFDLGTVDRHSLRAGPTGSIRESEHERIADSTWSFDTDRQPTVIMIVEAQSSRQRHFMVRVLRYVVDRLLELCEDRTWHGSDRGLPPVAVAVLYTGPDPWQPPSLQDLFSPLARLLMQFDFPVQYYDVLHMDRRDDPEQRLLRLVFAIERCADLGETVPAMQAVRGLEDRDAYELLMRFLTDKIMQWGDLKDEKGRFLWDASQLDDSRPLSEVEREMETVQERFLRQLAERRAEGQVAGVLVSFQRVLAVSGLDRQLADDVAAHANRIVEAARRGVYFDLDDIPDGVRLLAAIQEGGGPTQVPAEHIWALLPHIPEDDTAPK
ncbi:MAG: Rpn family recombination-promoting nuclease/putative transposase [Caldilineaceae bacterium]|nr:Rpn family recombination-promoting nuclease/putative transposase [Caldilineaceae bacterium]